MRNLPDEALHTRVGMGSPMEFSGRSNVWAARELPATGRMCQGLEGGGADPDTVAAAWRRVSEDNEIEVRRRLAEPYATTL